MVCAILPAFFDAQVLLFFSLTYPLHLAFPTALATLAIIAGGTILQGDRFPLWDFLWDNYIPLLSSNVLIAYFLATYVYVRSFDVKPPASTATDGPDPGRKHPVADKRAGGDLFTHRELAAGGHSGNMIYDWFIGRELNPPVQIPLIGAVDLKSFMELRPGMLGWLILNLAFIMHQHKLYGTITPSILITTASQTVYIFDALYNEPAILTTMDITTDGFGFMLAFGDLVWLPFTYSLQARYLAVHPVRLTVPIIALIITAQSIGYYIFRAANSQKNTFRTKPTDPSVASLSFIQTKAGSKLLTDGWWGRARHINYLGDWLMSWAYVLPTGFAGYTLQRSSPFRDHPHVDNAALIRDDNSLYGGMEVVPGEAAGWGMVVTYFFMLYFAILLVHRERRDEEKCRRKYGKDWEEYCRRVPSRIIPGIY